MGYVVARRRFGFFGRNLKVTERKLNQVLVDDLAPSDVGEFLADVWSYFEGMPADIFVDDRGADSTLGPLLILGGCESGHTNTYLAHAAPIPVVPAVPTVAFEMVGQDNLDEYVVTKLKAFANSEVDPDPDEVRAGVELRRAEMAGDGRFLLARYNDEPAAIVGWYEGEDRFVFLLGTRVPFRGRGIAKALLVYALADAYAQGCRSIIVNADPDDRPVQIYRQLGFIDEVYWRHLYRFEPKASERSPSR